MVPSCVVGPKLKLRLPSGEVCNLDDHGTRTCKVGGFDTIIFKDKYNIIFIGSGYIITSSDFPGSTIIDVR